MLEPLRAAGGLQRPDDGSHGVEGCAAQLGQFG